MDLPPATGCLTSKIAVITGAGRGIGRATAELFANEGATVVLCSRTKRQLAQVVSAVRANGGEAMARVTDIGVARDVQALIRFTLQQYGRLDILINNAGILGPLIPIVSYPHREWVRVLRINLTGTFFVSQAAARVMVNQGEGCIITVSSSVGRAGRARWGAYAASKFGVEGLSQVMADELRAVGIRIATFNPGGTRTGMRAQAYPSEDPSTVRPPFDAARALLQLVTNLSLEQSGHAFDLSNLP